MGIEKSRRGLAIGVGLCMFITSCAHPLASWSPETFSPTTPVPPSAFSNDEAHLLVEEHVVRFGEEGGVVVVRDFTRTKTRIQGKAGQDRRHAAIGYSSTFSRVELLEAHVTAPDGSVRIYGKVGKDIVDVPHLGTYMLYSDSRSRRLVIPEQPRGAVVEVAVIERSTSPELFAFSHAFGDTIPTDLSRFVVEAPLGWQLDIETRAAGVDSSWAPVVTQHDGLQRMTWERRALEPLPAATYAPSILQRVDVVAVRLRKATLASGAVVEGPADAVALSKLTATMADGQARVTPSIEQIVVEVLGDKWRAVPKRERAARLYAWTRDSIRYCAIEIGLGGWVPHPSDDVERLRYGDCKDKANLLKALLDVVEVDSHLVTIWSGYWPRPFMLPVVGGNFNHAILQVELDDGPVFVDPTTRTVAFADLPPNDEERECLPATMAGSPLVMTPSSSPTTDHRITTWRLKANDGNVIGTVDSETRGHFADAIRDQLLEAAEQDRVKVVASALGNNDTVLTSLKTTNEPPPVEVTPLLIKGETKLSLRSAQHGRMFNIVSAGTFLEDDEPVLDPDRPPLPVQLWARDRVVDDVHLELPAGWGVEHLPPPLKRTGKAASYTLSWSFAGNTLSLHREVTHHVTALDVDGVDEFTAGLSAFHRAMEANVLLTVPADAGSSDVKVTP